MESVQRKRGRKDSPADFKVSLRRIAIPTIIIVSERMLAPIHQPRRVQRITYDNALSINITHAQHRDQAND
jgi:hypothetical protein